MLPYTTTGKLGRNHRATGYSELRPKTMAMVMIVAVAAWSSQALAQPTPTTMLSFMQQHSVGHPDWAGCQAADEVACHRFVRSVVTAANPSCDPNFFGLLSKQAGENQCSMTECGSHVTGGYAGDAITWQAAPGAETVYDVISGVGAPNPSLQMLEVPRRPLNRWACITSSIPGAPTIVEPSSGATSNTTVTFVRWNGTGHSQYHMRVSTQNNPDAGIVYDSQQTASDHSFAWTGPLNNGSYFAFVREANAAGWGAWSGGRSYTVNTSFVPPGADVTAVKGNSMVKKSGPFVGLGFSYMTALRRCKYDRARFNSDLAFMASKEYKYMRALSMVGWYSAWAGKEIAPVSFTNNVGTFVPAWPDYWQQLTDMIDIAYDSYGIRTELTIFADAQLMPNKTTRINHMQTILNGLPGREHKIMHLEVANEAWQNGFPGDQGVADLREFCQYLTDRTSIPVGISATPFDSNNPNATLIQMYAGSTADIATEHFDRNVGTIEGGWFPVRDPWRCELASGVPPCSHNEPIGHGSSVASESDPIKLVMGAVFAWCASLPLYVYHTDAGVFGDTTFESRSAVGSYTFVDNILPPEVASWVRNDGKETASAFTSFSMGQSNKWWTEVGGATNGCVRNTGKIRGPDFVHVPIGILGGGLTIQCRRPMNFQVYNPLTGAVAYNEVRNAGEQLTLAAGPGAYIIKGFFTDVPGGGGGGGGGGTARLNVKPAGTITVDGNSSDWALGDFVTKTRGGEGQPGDIALVGFDGGSTVYRGAYVGVLPTSAADHTIKVYSRQNATYLYFLARVDDSDRRTPNPVSSNWANDCVEFYIDPSNNGGTTPLSNSTSDVQLVIDAANQKNVYGTTSGYATQVLAGVTSAVTTDAAGYWIEVRIAKSALDPDIPSAGTFGLDLNIRDNDNNNDAALTTVYTWNEFSTEGFPSKIPDHWGDAQMRQPFGGTPRAIPGVIQAEDFDEGGQGVAYNDAEATNIGGAYRPSEGVDIGGTADVGGGHLVGWNNNGEWMEYTVNVATTGDYAVKVRLASAAGGGSFHLSMNGTNITASKSFADTGGWDTWTTITVPGVFLTAGNNQILRFTTDLVLFNINYMEFVLGGADVVSIDLGNPDVQDGMTNVVCCDGINEPWTIGGHHARVNSTSTDHYMYFSIFDIYMYQGNKNNMTVTVEYYDYNTGSIQLQYDGTPSPYTVGPSQTLTGTNTWKTAVWQVGDAYCGNRQNGGADFRIFYTGLDFYIDTVMVFATVGVPPPGSASNPSPANGATGVAITGTTLSWTAGSGATNRDVRFGTANPPPFVVNQTATTYSPGTLAAGTTYFWRIDEKNSGGTTTGTVWSFTTLPVPGVASSPSPASGATGVNRNADLTWTAGSNATSHDVRFGTANPPPFVVNQAGTTYDPGTMAAGTTYFWRIDEKNGSGTTTGTVWSFTTLPLPGVASAPNPANGATGVSLTVDPTWTAGSNATSHDVRFGTSNPPPFVVNQAGTTYDPGTLLGSTTYFWRIDEVNSSGTTTGTVWSFTTMSALPGQASNPSPANGATNVATNSIISWTAGANATSHNLYGGTVNPPPFIQNQAGTSYNPGGLLTGTTYFWRIDEVNAAGTTTGVVWTFTTAGGSVTFSNTTFPSNSEGWNIVVWKSGQYDLGTMAWFSSGGNPTGNMRSAGSGGSNNTDSCTREGGEINKVISTATRSTLQVQYDARFETNQTGPTCGGACPVLEGTCADKLAVYYSTAGTGGPWTLLEAVNASAVTQNVWATRTLNLPTGANNQANFALRFRWQFNQSSDGGRLDNIKVIDLP